MRKKTLRFTEFWNLCKRELKYDLNNWKDDTILSWILDTSKNDVTIRRFLVEFWLWKHRDRIASFSVVYSKGKKGEHTVVYSNGRSLDFWIPIFRERGLLK